MKCLVLSLVCLQLLCSVRRLYSGEKEPDFRPYNYREAIRALAKKHIRANLSSEKMLDLCIPSQRCTLGRFTWYVFESIPNYHGLTIIAKDGLLIYAREWSCTYARNHFDKTTPEDMTEMRELHEKNRDVPFEDCVGRLGWRRPRMREWQR
jgi:hypothetical protein